MKNKIRLICCRMLVTAAIVSGFNMRSNAANESPVGPLPTIHYLDLSYTSALPADERYDIRHVAACLQGLANREAPRVFLTFHSVDNIWRTRLRESGGLCEGWGLYDMVSIEGYLSLFSEYATGVVLYDPDPNTGVISSSLVATTVAGVENGIAVRKDTSAGSMYNYLVNDLDGPQLPVLFDLTGKFIGSGIIWQTSTPSTGSAKCDAYIWAKEKYIDTGKCDPTTLMYTLDLWGLKVGANLDTQLSNLDYAVEKKGFCFELSPWGDEIPNDDPGQPLGADLDTFKQILNACNIQTGQSEMIKFCGFTSWNYKYTSFDSVGGSHGPVDTEWETLRILSAYNTYGETDAPGGNYLSNASFYNGLLPETENRRYVQNPAPTYSDLQAKGYIDGNGNVAQGNYILLGLGDYDQASWTLNWLAADRYDDPARGQTQCSWAIDPNAIDRVSVALDYMYRHKTAKDYFMAWDSGAGYVHPTQLYGSRSPSGYPSAVDLWQDHCRKYYRIFDYSITAWLLNEGSGGTMSTTEIDNYMSFSGDGMGFHNDLSTSPQIRNNIPYQRMNWGPTVSGAGLSFGWERTVLWYPSDVKAKEDASAANQHFLNAYEYYYLMRHHLGGNNNHRATWVSDTIPRIMAASQNYPVTVTVRNDGWEAWSETNLYRLSHAVLPEGSPAATAPDYDSTLPNRILLPGGTTVNPGESITFSFSLTAPSVNGDYDFYYDMVEDGVAWFRDTNNIEWKKPIIVATHETDIDTDGDGSPDVVEEKNGALYWHPDDFLTLVLLENLLQTYDGTPKPVSVTTTPPGLPVDLTYDGSTNAPINPGNYTVIGTVAEITHSASVTNTLVINPPVEYDAWKVGWFTEAEQTNAAISGPEVYYDSDGFNNWEEYISGTDPTDGQAFPSVGIQPVVNGYILNWSPVQGRAYSLDWSPDLTQGFIPLKNNLRWPQSSYTDQTHQAETEGFYQMDVSISTVITAATIAAGDASGAFGDLFHNATITANSAIYPSIFFVEDLFSGTPAQTIFADGTGSVLSYVDFNTANPIHLGKIIIGLMNDGASVARALNQIRVYASASAGDVQDSLVAEISVDPDYITAYGDSSITVSINLAEDAQYFRVEFMENNDFMGVRVMEIDGFSE